MPRRLARAGLTLLAVAMLILKVHRRVEADSAPPWYAQGASVETSESMTNVEMVSEDVLIVIEGLAEAGEQMQGLAAAHMVGHVQATFVMRNRGAEPESFDVWFPLNVPSGYPTYGIPIEEFSAWVNGTPVATDRAETHYRWGQIVSWATWPVEFPPGQDVLLGVAYDVQPFGYRPYGQFEYVLDTGSGWHGPIGGATVKIRLPYEVNEANVVFGESGRGTCRPNPETYFVSGTEVVWSYTNLEPTEDDNICLTVLAVPVWNEITAAQRGVAEAPDSAQAHLRLARAAADALQIGKPGLPPTSHEGRFAELARQSYERALRLAPQDVEAYVGYLQLMQSLWSPIDPVPGRVLELLDEAMLLAPDDERLLWIDGYLHRMQSYEAPTPTAGPTATPIRTPTASPAAVAGDTATSALGTPAAMGGLACAEQADRGPSYWLGGLALMTLAIAILHLTGIRHRERGPRI
jgi:hypothetical protein